jgi:hypothetical protein
MTSRGFISFLVLKPHSEMLKNIAIPKICARKTYRYYSIGLGKNIYLAKGPQTS